MLDRPDRLCSPCDHDGHTCAAFGCAQEVSGMGIIERWWLVMDSHEAPYAVRSTKGSADDYARNLNAACTVREVVPAEQLRGAVEDWRRIGQLASWIDRDRNERDKVTAYAGEIARLVARHGGR